MGSRFGVKAFLQLLWITVANPAAAFSGSMTYYNPDGGYGSCGNALQDSDYIVSMNPSQYDVDICGSLICITYNGITVQGTLQDRCAGCSYGDIDVSPPIFTSFEPISVGRFNIEWTFCDSSAVVQTTTATTTSTVAAVAAETTTSATTTVFTQTSDVNSSNSNTSSQTSSSSSNGNNSVASASTTSSSGNAAASTTTANQYQIPLWAPVQWPAVVNAKRTLSKRNGCIQAN
ncbi:hypothetical protein HK100_001480 [Physocladia obscura]|uniref:Uncharacterized protein n=1 Tax=Physocladia obscura TaxID=109957 RepID=A0AAD5T8D4_9FUNG|nr:hypothetical protein HK100_001480 [Physocladia obscura]